MATFEELLKETGLPDAALAPLREKWNEALSLITVNNKRVAQVNAARAKDPNDSEYQDSLWKSNEKTDPEIMPLAEKFYVVAEEYENLLAELRKLSKKHIPESLGEEETKKLRKLVNDSDPAIQTAKTQFSAMATMVDGYLSSLGKGIDGGLVSLLPQIESLKNIRGRKASTAAGSVGSYMTRIGAFEIDGRPIHRDGKTNFRYGADSVSNVFGADKFPTNKVTGEEIEEAYFKSLPNSPEVRSLSSTEIPESHTFDFTKEVKTGENTTETKTVKLTIKRKATEAKPETEKAEKAEAPKPEVPAPAKKAAATSQTTKK